MAVSKKNTSKSSTSKKTKKSVKKVSSNNKKKENKIATMSAISSSANTKRTKKNTSAKKVAKDKTNVSKDIKKDIEAESTSSTTTTESISAAVKTSHQNDSLNADTSATEIKEITEQKPQSSEDQAQQSKKGRRKKRQEKSWEEKAKALPVFEVSNFPKLPVKNILITQAKPADLQNPYQLLIDKYKVNIDFRPFIKVEGLTAQEFRNQRVDVLEHKGVIFTSRLAIDHFFRIMNEMRVVLPDSMKFFCLNEQIAYYMQKYMELRKRRIFWGQGSIEDLKKVLKKNIDGKFLLPASDTIREKVIGILDAIKAKYSTVDVYKTIPENISNLKPEKYDMIVFFTPIAVDALHKYFPKLKQDKIRFAAYSILTANKLKELGYRVDIYAPTKEFPSMVNAMAHYLLHINEKSK
jgi:uroporphyrinogen-III synthase